MAEIEQLKIIIDVVESFDEELNDLLMKLAEVEVAVDRIDGRRIDLDTGQAQASLAQLQAQMAGMRGQMAFGMGDADGGGGGGGRPTPGQMGAMSQDARDVGQRLSDLDLRMSDLHNALARLVPMILVFIGALPAVIGGLVTLASAALAAAVALGSIAAFGAMGAALVRGDGDMADGFQELADEVQDDFMDAFEPIMRQLAPLFERGVDGLDRLFQQIANEGDALTALSDEARTFGNWVIRTLPPFLRDLATFADVASGAIGVMMSELERVDWFNAFATYLADVLPHFASFVSLLMRLIPMVVEISIGFLQAANGILMLFYGLGQVLRILPITQEQFGLLVGGLLSLYAVALVANSAMLSLALKGLVTVGQYAVSAAASLFGLAEAQMVAALGSATLAKAMFVLAGAIAATGIGALLVVIGGVASGFAAASTNIDSATKSLRRFRQEQSRVTGGSNPYRNPDVQRGEGVGRSRFAGGSVNVTVEGDADTDTVRNQTHNGLYRMERPSRSR